MVEEDQGIGKAGRHICQLLMLVGTAAKINLTGHASAMSERGQGMMEPRERDRERDRWMPRVDGFCEGVSRSKL